MPLAQLTFPAIDLLALAFLLGFGVATLVFVPLLRREHRRGTRAATVGRSGRRARTGGSERRPDEANASEQLAPVTPPEPAPEDRPSAGGESDSESTMPDDGVPSGLEDTDPEAVTEYAAGKSSPARWNERVELCAAKHRVRFGQARARLLTISSELELE